MNTVTTRRNALNFYATLLFTSLFFCALGAFAISTAVDPAQQKDFKSGGQNITFILGCLIIFMAIYTVYQYFKNTPTISVDHDKISFGRRNFYWNDVSKIEFTGKQPFRYIFSMPMEGAKFTMKDGEEKYMFDYVYSNAWQIKLFIQQVVLNKSKVFELPATDITRSDFDHESFETFYGNQFISLRALLFWPLFIVFAIASYYTASTAQYGGFIIVSSVALFWFLLNAWLMNYFKVSENFIVIKNHLAFWKNVGYRLSDIKEVAFETRDQMPNCLRIITKDFRTKVYPAGTLRDKTWLQMKEKLESHGITARNECVYDPQSSLKTEAL